jgi:hypothetical protein
MFFDTSYFFSPGHFSAGVFSFAARSLRLVGSHPSNFRTGKRWGALPGAGMDRAHQLPS